MAKALCMVFCVGMIVLLLPLGTTARLCCDSECKRKISRVIILSLCCDLLLLLILSHSAAALDVPNSSTPHVVFGVLLLISIRALWAGLKRKTHSLLISMFSHPILPPKCTCTHNHRDNLVRQGCLSANLKGERSSFLPSQCDCNCVCQSSRR